MILVLNVTQPGDIVEYVTTVDTLTLHEIQILLSLRIEFTEESVLQAIQVSTQHP